MKRRRTTPRGCLKRSKWLCNLCQIAEAYEQLEELASRPNAHNHGMISNAQVALNGLIRELQQGIDISINNKLRGF